MLKYKILKNKIKSNFIIFLIFNFLTYLKTIYIYRFILRKNIRKKIIKKKKLLEILLQKKKGKKSGICHIIGSGNSIIHSRHKINITNDFIMGCNLAALMDLKFDFYSVEFASINKEYEPKYTVRNIVKRKLIKENTVIIFKNLSSNKLDLNFLNSFVGITNFILDYSWRCFNKMQLKYYIHNYLLKKNKEIFYQYNSTLILLISIAYELNFKKIVIHGLDFGGKYFFSNQKSIYKNKHLIHKNELSVYENININKKGNYQKHKALNMQRMFKLISDSLIQNKVTLYSGTKNSASSKFLKIFEQI